MAEPATTGQRRTNVSDMEVGDYIPVRWESPAYVFGEVPVGIVECPVGGQAASSITNRFWYMVKVDKGLLISDRVITNTISWDSLNTGKTIQCLSWSGTGTIAAGTIRSLTGGVAFATKDGYKATTDQGFGAWPANNEWDRYISNYPVYKIQEGKNLDDVFHINGISTLCQDTPINGVGNAATSAHRTQRKGDVHGFWSNLSNYSHSLLGFRPVFGYREV
ncbi:hypothetical protein [Paenibacillus sp. 22594]|uniref:hypothetical protein n=1 Tax=Paenibacillus sp. 22594 TaxID=3453947 RepID=UPI003F8590D1